MTRTHALVSIALAASSAGMISCTVDANDPNPPASLTAALSSAPRLLPLGAHSVQAVYSGKYFAQPPKFVNHGGAVLSNVKVVSVMWGANVDATVHSSIGAFYSSVLNSPYLDWLREYNTPTQSIGRGTFVGQWTITPTSQATVVSETAIASQLTASINAGTLPAADANSLYVVHLPPGVTASLGGVLSTDSKNGYCGYHRAADATGLHGAYHFRYAVLLDFGPGTACGRAGSDPVSFNNFTMVSTHEIVEAITNPDPIGTATTWTDASYDEIGDACSWQPETLFINGQPRVVQKEWSNSAGACVATNPFQWKKLQGCAVEIAAGPNGLAYVLGCDLSANYDYSIWAWSGLDWYRVPGRATRIALSPEGTPWIITSTGAIQRWDAASSSFRTIDAGGCASSIGVGPNDTAWVTGCSGPPGSYDRDLYQLVGGPSGQWRYASASASQVTVSPGGSPWALTHDGTVWRWDYPTQAFVTSIAPACATWLAPSDADTWAIGCGTENGIYLYRSYFPGWDRVNGVARRVAVQADGSPWVLGTDGSIYTQVRAF